MKKNNLSVFLTCILLATLFWFLNAFTKNYDKVVNVPVRYVKLPKNKAILNELPDNINIELSANGFYLLTNNLFKTVDTIDISGELIQEGTGKTHKNFIQTRRLIEKFTEQLGAGVKVKNILTDTIYFDFDKLISKKVLVKPNINYTLEKQFLLDGKVNISPPFVKITGPQSIVDTMTFVSTEFASFPNLKEDINREVKILTEHNNIVISPEKVTLKIPVEKFIEKTIDIPVQVENVPKRVSVKIVPEKTSVICRIPQNLLEKINPEHFNASVDYNEMLKNTGKLKVKISKFPPFASIVKVSPEKVEYVLKK